MIDKECSMHPHRPAQIVVCGEGVCDVCMRAVRCPSCGDMEIGRHADDTLVNGALQLTIECSQCGHAWTLNADAMEREAAAS